VWLRAAVRPGQQWLQALPLVLGYFVSVSHPFKVSPNCKQTLVAVSGLLVQPPDRRVQICGWAEFQLIGTCATPLLLDERRQQLGLAFLLEVVA
jgi:hypothetical protein